MSSSSGQRPSSKVSVVPHRGQKLRVIPSLEAKCRGASAMKRKSARRTLNQATAGAPDSLRQSVQWHKVLLKMSPVTS
jgi:hypothetical protein